MVVFGVVVDFLAPGHILYRHAAYRAQDDLVVALAGRQSTDQDGAQVMDLGFFQLAVVDHVHEFGAENIDFLKGRVRVLIGLGQQRVTNVVAAYFSLVFLGAKEFVYLLEHLADGPAPTTMRSYRFMVFSFHGPHPVLGLDHHSLRQLRDTGADIGHSVHHHHTVRTAPDGAEDVSGLVPSLGIAANHDPCRHERRRDGLARVALHPLSVKGKGHQGPLLNFT